jgi:hypothetical protein
MSTFAVDTVAGLVTTTFRDRIQGSNQGVADLWELTLSVLLATEAEFQLMLSLVTTKYGVHVPLGGQAVIDVVNGPGEGTLICGLGTTTALLVDLKRGEYLSGRRSIAVAQFLITSAWIPPL